MSNCFQEQVMILYRNKTANNANGHLVFAYTKLVSELPSFFGLFLAKFIQVQPKPDQVKFICRTNLKVVHQFFFLLIADGNNSA